MSFQMYIIPFFGKNIAKPGMRSGLRNMIHTSMPVPKLKNELQAFPGIMNYISRFSPATAKVYKLLPKLKSVKTK